jgi:hypothetical protein
MSSHKRSFLALATTAILCAGALTCVAADNAPEASGQLGSKEGSRWTETTLKAVTSPDHQKVLDSGKVSSVTGEIVEVSCYLQLGKRGEKHVPCGSECIKNGMPPGVVDAKGNLYLILAEEHDPRRFGKADIRDKVIPLMAKTATVTGMLTEKDGYKALYIQAIEGSK